MGVLTRGQYTFGNKTKTQITQLTTAQTLTGTASISLGATTLNGTGTLFTQELFVGDVIGLSGRNVTIATIVSNTQLTLTAPTTFSVSGSSISLLNPKRIRNGDSVFNTTDNYPMYYSGDNNADYGVWKRGSFCNGQIIPIKNVSETTTITAGQVLQPSSSTQGTIEPYSAGTIDPAISVTYFDALGSCCVSSAVCGIVNTDITGTIATKGNFTQPSITAGQSTIVDDGASTTADSCGIAMTSSIVAGEISMYVNFQERL